MDNENIAVMLQDHKGRIGSLEHRMDKLEELTDSVNNLAITTSTLVTEQKHMNENFESLRDQIDIANKRPADRLEQIKTAIITAMFTSVIGAVAVALISIL